MLCANRSTLVDCGIRRSLLLVPQAGANGPDEMACQTMLYMVIARWAVYGASSERLVGDCRVADSAGVGAPAVRRHPAL